MSRLYLPDSGLSYQATLLEDLTRISPRCRGIVVRGLRMLLSGTRVWLRQSKELMHSVARLQHITRLTIDDERLAYLATFVPAGCRVVDFVCRRDWYGKPGMKTLALALSGSDTVQQVFIGGVVRECDALSFSKLAASDVVVHDRRQPLQNQEPRSTLFRMWEKQKAIEHYQEVFTNFSWCNRN